MSCPKNIKKFLFIPYNGSCEGRVARITADKQLKDCFSVLTRCRFCHQAMDHAGLVNKEALVGSGWPAESLDKILPGNSFYPKYEKK